MEVWKSAYDILLLSARSVLRVHLSVGACPMSRCEAKAESFVILFHTLSSLLRPTTSYSPLPQEEVEEEEEMCDEEEEEDSSNATTTFVVVQGDGDEDSESSSNSDGEEEEEEEEEGDDMTCEEQEPGEEDVDDAEEERGNTNSASATAAAAAGRFLCAKSTMDRVYTLRGDCASSDSLAEDAAGSSDSDCATPDVHKALEDFLLFSFFPSPFSYFSSPHFCLLVLASSLPAFPWLAFLPRTLSSLPFFHFAFACPVSLLSRIQRNLGLT